MFARVINVFFVLFFALPLFTGVSASPRRRPGNNGGGGGNTDPGSITSTTTTNNNCNVGSIACCNSVQNADATNFGDLFGPLSSLIGPISGNIGLTCSPTTVGGTGSASCNAQTVCCDNNHFNGLIAVGCNPINVH